MREFPRSIQEYIYHLIMETYSPVYMLIDKNGGVVEWGGKLGVYGIPDLQSGAPIGEQVHFLEGVLPVDEAPLFLPCIETASGRFADVYIFSTDAGDGVLLLDATATAIQQQRMQQKANDLSLCWEKLRQILILYFGREVVEKMIREARSLQGKWGSQPMSIPFFEEDLTGHFVATPNGQIQVCNAVFARIFGFASVEEARQCLFATLFPTPDAQEDFLALLRQEKKLENYETELRRLDGKPVYVLSNIIGTFNAQGELVEIRGYLFDQTEQKTLEEQLRHVQKMEAMGHLAVGIAHDFNNIVTVINGYGEFLRKAVRHDAQLVRHVNTILEAADRASIMTRQLLTFSRRQAVQPKVLDLNSVVVGVGKMLQRLLGEHIELVILPSSMPSTVKADLGQLEQVIVNLAVNARDAMSQGGRLTIETSHRVLDDTAARWHGFVQPGSYVLLTVSDTGIGMDRATQARIFEPFFTTKEPGKGTGMGLAVVYGIVKQNNGHIWVYSEPGQGTTFKIYFPQIVAPVEIGKSANTLVTYPEGSETILVVEDDKEVLDAVCDLLQMQGYVVLKAQQGDEAFHICAQHQGPIHLLLTDVVLPQMSGQELSQRLLLLYPQIKVLYMTGYTIDTILHHGLINQGMHCIQKPFSMHDLFHKLRELLESR